MRILTKKKWFWVGALLLVLGNLYFSFQFYRYRSLYRSTSGVQQSLVFEFDRMALRTMKIQERIEHLPFFQFVEYANRRRSPIFHQILDSVYRHANKYDLDPYLLLSLIYHESGFNPQAISVSGACGLMQVNLSVWKDFLQLEEEKIFEVDYNIDVGCRIFQRYLTETEGDLERALYMYNNGYMENGNVAYPDMVLKGKFILKPTASAG